MIAVNAPSRSSPTESWRSGTMPGRGDGGPYGGPHCWYAAAAGCHGGATGAGGGCSVDHPGGGRDEPGAAQSPGSSPVVMCPLLVSDRIHRVRATTSPGWRCHHGHVSRGRVLVVDDDPALAEMLGIVLRTEGFEPSFVADGDRALAAFRATKPDLVLLDLMLPGTD